MLKVLFVVPLPPPYGGIANWTLLIKKYIHDNNTIEAEYINSAPPKRDVDGRAIIDRIIFQGFRMFKINQKLKQRIKKFKPDVIHFTTSGQFAVIRDLLLLRTARMQHINTVYHIRFGRVPEIAKINSLEWRLISRAMRLATTTIVIDKNTFNTIQRYHPDLKKIYIPNPFDFNGETIPTVARQEVVFIGWVIKTKGIEELLVAWKAVFAVHPDWTLKIVGPYKKDYFESLKARFPFNGVVFTGEQPHAIALKILSQAQIFILPSYTEGFPNSVLEAMAYSKAIVASDVGAISDMLSDSCGIVIPAKNSEAITTALNKLIVDKQLIESIGINAKKRLHNEYSIDRIFRRYMSIWKCEEI